MIHTRSVYFSHFNHWTMGLAQGASCPEGQGKQLSTTFAELRGGSSHKTSKRRSERKCLRDGHHEGEKLHVGFFLDPWMVYLSYTNLIRYTYIYIFIYSTYYIPWIYLSPRMQSRQMKVWGWGYPILKWKSSWW